jgi:hypothetical protein
MLEPIREYVEDLIKRIDESLKPLGAMYTITVKK